MKTISKMKSISLYSAAIFGVVMGLGQVVHAAVDVNGDTISWDDDGWYQVQRADNYATVCEGGTSCDVEPGVYNVINHTTGQRYENITVRPPTSGEPAVDGTTISWADDGWYQVQRADNYATVCEGGTSCDVEPGEYNVINHSTGQRWDGIIVSTDTDTDTGYQVEFFEGFDENSVNTGVWEIPSWANSANIPNRNFANDAARCTVVDEGGITSLRLEAKVVNNEIKSCYMATNPASINRHGPGQDNIMKIEYRVNISQLKAFGAWFGAWVSNLDTGAVGDNNPSTGHEIDVLEYIPFVKADGT